MERADLEVVGRGLAARIRDLRAALDRLDSFAFRPGQESESPGGSESPGESERMARELVLRALRALSDPLNHDLLSRLANEGGASVGDLQSAVSLPRLAVWERLSDLLQVGLVERSLEGDRAALTPVGAVLVRLVEDMTNAAAGAGP